MSGQLDDFADRRLRGDPSLLGHVIGGAAGPSGAGRGTPKPLHWTRIRVIAVVVGMALTVTVLAIVAGAAGTIAGVPLGAITGLLAVTAMERAGVFRRTDEL